MDLFYSDFGFYFYAPNWLHSFYLRSKTLIKNTFSIKQRSPKCDTRTEILQMVKS